MRAVVLVAPLLLLLACQSGGLGQTRDAALAELRALRPAVELGDVRVRDWSGDREVAGLLEKERTSPWYLDVESILDEQSAGLIRLGIVDASAVASVRESFGGVDPTLADAEGIAIPSAAVVFIDPSQADSLETVAHELAHVASHRMRYEERLRPDLSLKGSDRLDPAWADIDAVISLWALSEGEAQMTANAAVARKKGGARGLRDWLRGDHEVDAGRGGARLTGPARITRPDGEVVSVRAGEVYRFAPRSLVETLQYLAYEGSLALYFSRRVEGETLEETLRRTWSESSLTTRELLEPEQPAERSRLAERLRRRHPELPSEAVGATRAGALLLLEMLVRRAGWPWKKAGELATALEDDIVIRGTKGVLWISQWRDEDSARAFADVLQNISQTGAIDREGNTVVVVAGEFANRDQVLGLLCD